jgi:formate--tetrahydrofolate ligase
MAKTDIEIAREATPQHINDIGAKLGIPTEHLLPYGHDKAKVSAEFIKSIDGNNTGKLILVTAINPTPASTASARRRRSASAKPRSVRTSA